MKSDKIIIIVGLVVGVLGLAVMIGFIGQGNVREVPLFYPEKVEQTVSFEEVNGKVQLVGITGIKGEVNPTLLTRTSFAYILTVINNGTTNHRLYIEGLNAQTDLLDPGQNDTITVFPNEEGTYNYYDKRETLTFLGKLKVVTVVPSDEFQGFLKDIFEIRFQTHNITSPRKKSRTALVLLSSLARFVYLDCS